MTPRILLLALLAAIAGAGCTRLGGRPFEPAAGVPGGAVTVHLFNDGFHSGLVVPAAALPLEVRDPYGDERSRTLPWVEIGYGEEQWLTARDQGSAHAASIFLRPAQGMLLVRYLERPFPPRIRDGAVRSWPLRISPGGWARFCEELAGWVDTEAHVLVPRDQPGTYYLYARKPYWIGRTCHDFTADCLRSYGLPLAGWPIRWNDAMQHQIDDAVAVLADHAIPCIDPSLFAP